MATSTVGRVIRLFDAHKAKAAFLAPVLLALAAAAANWLVTGEFDATEIRVAAGGAVLAAASALATYLAPAGRAEIKTVPFSAPAVRKHSIGDQRGYGDPLYWLAVVAVALIVLFLAIVVIGKLDNEADAHVKPKPKQYLVGTVVGKPKLGLAEPVVVWHGPQWPFCSRPAD